MFKKFKRIKTEYIIAAMMLLAIGGGLLLFFVPTDHRNVYEKAVDQSVMIQVRTEMVRTYITFKDGGLDLQRKREIVTITGSGVFISANGHILTCAHLFDNGKIVKMYVTTRNRTAHEPTILAKDHINDLALLKIKAWTPDYAQFAPENSLRIGDPVFAVGTPLGLPFSVSHGIVSALNRWEVDNKNQSDTFLNPGNSGGPLFDRSGRLVGINVSIVPPILAPVFTGLGFSVPVSTISAFLERYRGLESVYDKF